MKFRHTEEGGISLDAKVPEQMVFNGDGSVSIAQRNLLTVPRGNAIATVEDVYNFSLPRFISDIWTGLASAIPEGWIQSSGQQVFESMYPNLREDVVATQFTCTETEWQNNSYKRATHWSLGDESSWLRCPDKNGVQAGNAGSFYGTGSDPTGSKTGTAVGDAGRNLVGTIGDFPNFQVGASGPFASYSTGMSTKGSETVQYTNINFDASRQWPVANEFRPRTWYGIYIIRMYGRVKDAGSLNAVGLASALDAANQKIEFLENSTTFLYPNGGTATNPAVVSNNWRSLLDNPWPGYFIEGTAYVFSNSRWATAGWDGNTGTAALSCGIRVGYDATNDKVVVQTGSLAVDANSVVTGSSSGTASSSVISAPCFIMVERKGKRI